MALDGIFLRLLCRESENLRDMRIEKIYQPSRDELVLLLRSAGRAERLLVSAKSGFSRIALIKDTPDNPADPPTFCKLLRKYIGGAKIVNFEQRGLDRTVFIRLSVYNEMGDLVHPFIAVELFTGRSNIILCEESGRIIDAIHRSDIESGSRLIQPGAKYEEIPPQDKLNPFTSTAEAMAEAVICSGKPLGSAFMAAIAGVSPLISRELADKTALDPDLSPLASQKEKIASVLTEYIKVITDNHRPTLLIMEGETKDFTYMPINQYGDAATNASASSYYALLEDYYALRDKAARLKAAAADLSKLLTNLKSRAERRLVARLSELEQSRDREQLRVFGELLKANLYAVPKGADGITVQNYYDPELKSITIPLNPAISPAANAAKYFKDYKKAHTAEQTLSALCDKDREELRYIDSVQDALSRAETVKDIADIRDELCDAGYIFRLKAPKKQNSVSAPKEYTDPLGFRIAVGRNNRENDLLTLKTAGKEDIWLHTKDIPGSHVIIFTEGKEVPEETIIFAARLAAKNSKASGGSNVPVDAARVKYVKKPSGAKPGMVIYTHNRTFFVTP